MSPQFFFPTAALTLLIARNGSLTWRHPRNFIPASVQMEVDVKKFEDIFVRTMGH